jgi:hypothetical protein
VALLALFIAFMALYLAGGVNAIVSSFEKYVSNTCDVIADQYSNGLTVQFQAGLSAHSAHGPKAMNHSKDLKRLTDFPSGPFLCFV